MTKKTDYVRAVKTVKTPLGRWILVLPAAPDWGWSGMRWTRHRNGVGDDAQVSNWATEQEALDYAKDNLLEPQA